MDDQTLLEAVDQIEDDLALAETSDALELQIGTDKAAPEASEEIYVSLWDKLSIELQEVVVTFVKNSALASVNN